MTRPKYTLAYCSRRFDPVSTDKPRYWMSNTVYPRYFSKSTAQREARRLNAAWTVRDFGKVVVVTIGNVR